MIRNCPDCKQQMAVRVYDGVSLDLCEACAGIWFDDGELRQLIQTDPVALTSLEESAAKNAVESAPATGRRCPSCARVLDRYRYLYDSPLELDRCDACQGIWVEDGELAKMQSILDERSRPDSPREQAAIALANIGIESDREIVRQQRISSFLNILRRRPYWPYFP